MRKRRGGQRREEGEPLLEKELLEREILLWARDLAWEMNLRLLLDDELGLGKEDRILFVESVSVTGVRSPVERKSVKKGKISLFERIKLYFKRKKESLWQLLNSLLGYRWIS